MRLAIVASHPIQYYAPLFRALAGVCEIEVFYACEATATQQADAGFAVPFQWDVDLLSGYPSTFLRNRSRAPGPLTFAGADIPDIRRVLADGDFSAVMVGGWHLKAYCQAVFAAKRLGLPVLVRGDSQLATPRSALKRAAKALLYPPLLNLFDAALPVGVRSRAYYRHYGFPESRLFDSPHCIDVDWFAERATAENRARMRAAFGIGEAEAVALFAGKLVDFKRPLDAVEACAAAGRSGNAVSLAVAGAGALETALRSRADELGVKLHFFGFQNQSTMPSAYAAADVLILPSDARETWGLVCNEALACGRPIVVSDAVGCAEDLARPSVGRRYAMGDTEAAGRALRAALDHPPPLQALQQVSSAHSPAAAAAGIVSAFAAVSGTEAVR